MELSAAITLDIIVPGVYDSPFVSANSVLPAGTRVSSHLFYFDPLPAATREATFTFDEDIIGVIVLSDPAGADRFFSSDFLRHPLSVAPGAHFNLRGIEFGPETITLHPGLRDLTLDLTAGDPGDQVRVLTRAAATTPEPASLAVIATGLVLLSFIRRRR